MSSWSSGITNGQYVFKPCSMLWLPSFSLTFILMSNLFPERKGHLGRKQRQDMLLFSGNGLKRMRHTVVHLKV